MPLARNQHRVLDFLATREREVAGIEVAGIEVADALGGLARSSAYAALAALQRDGLVRARWDLDGPHPRRLVRISAQGRRALAGERATARRPRSRQGLAEGGAS